MPTPTYLSERDWEQTQNKSLLTSAEHKKQSGRATTTDTGTFSGRDDTRFVQALDQHRFGAVMLILVMVAAGLT